MGIPTDEDDDEDTEEDEAGVEITPSSPRGIAASSGLSAAVWLACENVSLGGPFHEPAYVLPMLDLARSTTALNWVQGIDKKLESQSKDGPEHPDNLSHCSACWP
jgi:hypothetical protein